MTFEIKQVIVSDGELSLTFYPLLQNQFPFLKFNTYAAAVGTRVWICPCYINGLPIIENITEVEQGIGSLKFDLLELIESINEGKELPKPLYDLIGSMTPEQREALLTHDSTQRREISSQAKKIDKLRDLVLELQRRILEINVSLRGTSSED